MPQLELRRYIKIPRLSRLFVCDCLIECGFVFLLCFLTFTYGGVQTDSISILEFTTVFIFLAFLWRTHLTQDFNAVNTKTWLVIGVFVGYIAFLVLPIPASLLDRISHSTYLIYRHFIPQHFLSNFDMAPKTLSVYPYAAFFEMRLLCSYLVLFYVALNFFKDWRAIRTIFKVMFALAFIIAIFGVSQGYHPTGKIYWFQEWSQQSNFFGPYINKNHFAAHMLLVLPYFLIMVIFAKVVEQRILAAFGSAVIIIASCMSLSRGGIVSFALMITVFFVILGTKNIKSGKILIISAVFFISLFFLIYIGVGPIGSRFVRFFTASDVATARGYIWRDTIQMWKDFPFFGVGLGNFSYVIPLYKRFFIDSFYTHAENEYLELLAEIGIIGVALCASIFVLFLNRLLNLYRLRRHTTIKAYLAAGIVSMIGFLFHSVSNFNFHMPSLMMHFLLIVALTHNISFIKFHSVREEDLGKIFKGGLFLTGSFKATYHYPFKKFSLSQRQKMVLFSVCGVASLFFVMSVHAQYASYRYLQKSLKSVVRSNFYLKTASGHRNALINLQKASAREPSNAALSYRLGVLYADVANDRYLSRVFLDFKGAFPRKVSSSGDILSVAGDYYNRSIELCPTVALYHLNLGWLKDIELDRDAARREFAKVLVLDATNSYIKKYLGRFYLQKKDFPLAFYFFGHVIDEHPRMYWELMRTVQYYDYPEMAFTDRAITLTSDVAPSLREKGSFYAVPIEKIDFYYGLRWRIPYTHEEGGETPLPEAFIAMRAKDSRTQIRCALTKKEGVLIADIPDMQEFARNNFPNAARGNVMVEGLLLRPYDNTASVSCAYYIPEERGLRKDSFDARTLIGPWQDYIFLSDPEELLHK